MTSKLKPKSEFSRNVLTLMTGTTIAQSIPIAISPILTRIYTPEDFGIVALFVAIASIFGTMTNGRYELAIMLPKKDEDAINIFALGFIVTSTISLFLLILILLFNDYFAMLLNNDEMEFWLYFVPIVVFFTGIFNILSYFNNRKKNYKDIAKATIIKSIVLAVVQLSIGFVKSGAVGLVSGQIISQMFANMQLFKNIVKDKVLLSKIKKIKIVALAKRYKDFPKFTMWTGLLNTVSLQIPVLIMSAFFNGAVIGFYSLSNRLVTLPMSLIGGSIGKVFYEQSGKIRNNKKALRNLTSKTYKNLMKIGIVPFGVIVIFGDYIFAFVFGNEWRLAGEYAQLLGILALFVFISAPLSNLFYTLEKQKEAMYFNIAILISRVIAIIIGGILFQDAYLTILLYVLVGVIFFIFFIFYIFKMLAIDIINIALFTIRYFILILGGFGVIRFYI